MAEVYLGIDIGTTSAKCMAVDDAGRMLAIAQQHYPMNHPKQGWAEQNPEDYWNAFVTVVQGCVEKLREQGYGSESIKALSLSTQGDTLILLDSDGHPLAPAISWMDVRASVECRELVELFSQDFWYRETGIRLTPNSSVAKLKWLKKNNPDLLRKATPAFVPDYIYLRLTGQNATDTPSASWCALFNPFSRDWSEPVLEILEIDRGRLSNVLESGLTIGQLTREAAESLGLNTSVRVAAGAFDQAAAGHGAGAKAGGTAVLSCGTAWVLYAVSGNSAADPGGNLPICCHVHPDEWSMVLPFPGGGTYNWLQGILSERGEADLNADTGPLVFIPHLYGELSPGWISQSRGSLLGLTMAHTTNDIEAALMRGIACETRRNLEAAERMCGSISSVRMVGGAGNNPIWPQIIANQLNCTVEVSECLESACYGAAMLAAGEKAAEWDLDTDFRYYHPDISGVEHEAQEYERYLRFYKALVDVYIRED